MRISAKSDYAVRVAAELAAAGPDVVVNAEELARRQAIPPKFAENILSAMRTGGIVVSRRGAEGGYRLARPAREISVADVIRAVDGPLADVHGLAPEHLDYDGAARSLKEVWIALRANVRTILERVTLEHLAREQLPAAVERIAADPDAWRRR